MTALLYEALVSLGGDHFILTLADKKSNEIIFEKLTILAYAILSQTFK